MSIFHTFKAIYKSIPSSTKWDWWLIFLCICISAVIWLFQSLNKSDYRTTIAVPLELSFLRKDIIALEEVPQYVEVQISGNGWNLLKKTFGVGISPLEVEVEDPIKQKYISTRALMPDIVKQLREVRIDFIKYDSIVWDFDSLVSKKVALYINGDSIHTAENHRLVSAIQLTPDTLQVQGAASIIETLADSLEIQLEQQNIKESFNDEVEIPLESSKLISYSPQNVKVNFEVDMYFKKNVTLPVHPLHFPTDSSIYLARSMAIVEYHVRRSNEMNTIADSLEIFADLNSANPKDSTINPIFSPPFFMEDVSVLPQKLKLIYAKPKKTPSNPPAQSKTSKKR